MSPFASNVAPCDYFSGRRGEIYEVVLENPGINFVGVCRESGYHFGNTEHHLRVLEEIGAVESFKAGRYRRYYAAGENHHREKRIHALLMNRPYGETADVVEANPGSSQTAIADALADVTRQTVAYRLRRMENVGAVDVEPNGRAHAYWLTPAAVRARSYYSDGHCGIQEGTAALRVVTNRPMSNGPSQNRATRTARSVATTLGS